MAALDTPGNDALELADMLPVRVGRLLFRGLRPWLGWLPLAALALLCALAAVSLGMANWVRQPENRSILITVSVMAPLTTWWLAGWKRPPSVARYRLASYVIVALVLCMLGLLLISVLLLRWLPPASLLAQWAQSGDGGPILAHMQTTVDGFGARATLWWLGARAGGASGDEYIFTAFAASLLWLMGMSAAALLRATGQGLAGALPPLLVLGSVVFLSGVGRQLFIFGLAVALALHLAADNDRLTERWSRLPLDYSRDLFLERWLGAAGLAAVTLAIAALVPVISIDSIATLYARLVEPVDARLEGVRQQAFPNIEVRPRVEIAGSVTGLPNDFLLGSGPELSSEAILTVRTSDGGSLDEPAERPYLRALLLDTYTGLGWEMGEEGSRSRLPANTRRAEIPAEGRRILAQTVRMQRPSRTWYAASEPLEFSTDALLIYDIQQQFITASGNPGAYSVLSAMPALSDEALAALPAWSATNALPDSMHAYLDLPATVTARARALAASLTEGIASPYRQAQAIETYLRTFAYDLDIPHPPAGVTDVADWFLFELQRGYCDYYATAFVVMARAIGLPARFATGYAPGGWQQYEQAWFVTAAQSHSWPEVYLPEIGWVAFEPTAGRSPLPRLGTDVAPLSASAPPSTPTLPAEVPTWNWQMLVWILPPTLVAWGLLRIWRWRQERRTDPWLGLQAWGARIGRPLGAGETPQEYGEALADLAETWALQPQRSAAGVSHMAGTVARESRALAAAAGAALYAPPAVRGTGLADAEQHWQRLRPLLSSLSRRRMHR